MAKVLTQLSIDKLKPGRTRREIPDGKQNGLFLIVQPTGRTSWAFRYRFKGLSRKYTIGAYPSIGLAGARQAAASRPSAPLHGL
jgi:hypothetical protein